MGKIITVLVGISKFDVLASTEFVYNPNSNTMGHPIPFFYTKKYFLTGIKKSFIKLSVGT